MSHDGHMSSGDEHVPLLPIVREIVEDFSVGPNGEVALADEKIAPWSARLSRVPAAEQEEVAVQLVAVAREFALELGEASTPVVAPLASLVAGLLGVGGARRAFETQALEFDTKWLGGSADRRPVGSGPKSDGAMSPLQLRVSKKSIGSRKK